MAKLGLVFICVFLLVQWSLAARVVRDAPETPTKPEGGAAANQFDFSETLNTLTQQLQKTFSKENLDKVLVNLGDTGEKLKEFGQSVITKAQETAADIANSASKKENEKST